MLTDACGTRAPLCSARSRSLSASVDHCASRERRHDSGTVLQLVTAASSIRAKSGVCEKVASAGAAIGSACGLRRVDSVGQHASVAEIEDGAYVVVTCLTHGKADGLHDILGS